MPVFPTYDREQGLGGVNSPSYASPAAFSGGANALSAIGGALSNVGNDWTQLEAKVRESQDNTWFSKARAETAADMQKMERERQLEASAGGAGYTDTVRGLSQEYMKAKLESAPSDRSRSMLENWSFGYSAEQNDRAARFQANAEIAQRGTDFDAAMNLHEQTILADPSQYEAVKRRAMDDFEGARQWMTPEQETQARDRINKSLRMTRAKAIVDYDPEKFLNETTTPAVEGRAAIAVAVDQIIQVESGGNANAKNPTSSASGLGQFIDSTWVATIRKHRPDLADLSDKAIIGMKNDPVLGKEMTTRFTEDNASALSAAGHEVTPGNLYLAHFSGIGGANAILSAQGNAPVSEVLGAAAVKANKFLAGKTASDLREWADKKMGGKGGKISVVMKDEYKGLSADELQALHGRAESNFNAKRAADYGQLKDSVTLAITTGDITSEDQIAQSNLNNGDKSDAINRFRSQNQDQGNARTMVNNIAGGTASADPYDAKAQKTVDAAVDIMRERSTPEQFGAIVEDTVRQTGVVPKSVLNELRAGIDGRDPAAAAAALSRASRISQVDGAALSRRDGGKAVQEAADDYSYYVDELNIPPEAAAQKIIDARDPVKQRERKALEPSAKEFVKSIAGKGISPEFSSWLGDPAIGFNPSQAAGINAEYLAIAEEQFYKANGDADIAMSRASAEIKRMYGVTSVTGKNTVMKHPPEKYWPAFDNRTSYNPFAGKDHSYAQAQLEEDLKEFNPNVDMSSVQLVTTPETDAQIKRGELPGYAVMYMDEDGVYQTIPGKLWKPDIESEEIIKRDAASVKLREDTTEVKGQRELHGRNLEDYEATNQFHKDKAARRMRRNEEAN